MDIDFLGYKIIDVIYQSDKTSVYRAIKEDENKIYVLKVSIDFDSNFKFKAIFEQEQRILDILAHDAHESSSSHGVIRGAGLKEINNRSIILLEDAGLSLQDVIDKDGPFSVSQFLKYAIKITEGLGFVHQHHIIHKDIKPSNIMLIKEKDVITIIDFNISGLLTREKESLTNNKVLEGSLPFMSPEQTGRMNRDIDYRSDFYSLGQTFYTLLTGKIAFNYEDPMEIIHSHIAKPMPSISAVSGLKEPIPNMIDSIINKLCSKNGEDRYQTSYGLLHDLKKCHEQWEKEKKIDSFALAEKDISNRFEIPQKLYGREEFLKILWENFNLVVAGEMVVLLVKGPSGIGKSALVHEVHRPMVKEHGHFMSGKFEQFKREIPYSALKQSFAILAKQLIVLNEEKLGELKKDLEKVIGRNLRLITDFSPEMIPILGELPKVDDLPPAESMNRLNLTLANFFRTTAKKDHPLIIFIDDLQWADGASLQFIQMLLTEESMRHILFIGSFRDNEVDPRHPWALIIEELKKTKLNVVDLLVTPLREDHLQNLLHDMFKRFEGDEDKIKAFAKIIHNKTGGNPFFVGEYLKRIYLDKIINFNGEKGLWDWDNNKILSVNVSDNVVDLMIDKLMTLSPDTQKYLKLASCVGAEFSLKSLSIVSTEKQLKVAQGLWEAVQDGLLFTQGEDFKAIQGDMQLNVFNDATDEDFDTLKINYKFSHDRVQQASYALISLEEKEITHLKIARLLNDTFKGEEKETFLFDIVNHFNIAKNLIKNERKFLLNLNLNAGIKALSIQAFLPSLNYARLAFDLMEESDLRENYEEIISLYKLRVEVENLNHNMDEAKKIADLALTKANNNIDKAEIYLLLANMYTHNNDHELCLQMGLNAFAQLGIKENINCGKIRMVVVFIWGVIATLNFKFEKFLTMPKATDKKDRLIIEICSALCPSGFITRLELIIVLVTRTFLHASKRGGSELISFIVITYGIINWLVMFRKKFTKNLIEVCDKMLLRFPNEATEGRVLLVKSYVTTGMFYTPEEYQNIGTEGVIKGIMSGDFIYATFNAGGTVLTCFFNGKIHLTELSAIVKRLLKVASDSKTKDIEEYGRCMKLNVDSLKGLTKALDDYTSDELDGEAVMQNYFDLYNRGFCAKIWSMRMINSYLGRNFKKVINLSRSVPRYHMPQLGTINVLGFMTANGLSMAELLSISNVGLLNKILYRIKILYYAGFNAIYSIHGDQQKPQTFLLLGKFFSLHKMDFFAIKLLNKSIFYAKKFVNHLYWGMAHEELGRIHLKKGNIKEGYDEINNAITIFDSWGALGKVNQLKREFPFLKLGGSAGTVDASNAIKSSKLEGITRTIVETISENTTSRGEQSSNFLDLTTAMKSSQILAQEVKVDQLMRQMMNILVQNAGAERCFFITIDRGSGESTNSQNLKILAKFDSNSYEYYESRDLKNENKICHTLINAVNKMQSPVTIVDISNDDNYAADPYVLEFRPKSIMCFPIIYQKKLMGILYLENNLNVGVFTDDRVEFLRIITSQLAISLENAYLYQNLENEVRKRTDELKLAQKKMLELAKKSGMSDISSGILHNIGNLLPSLKLLSSNLKSKIATKEIGVFSNILNLLKQNESDYNKFLKEDTKGIKILPTLEALKKELENKRIVQVESIDRLIADTAKIENIVKEHKRYTHSEVFKEEVNVNMVVDECIRKVKKNFSAELDKKEGDGVGAGEANLDIDKFIRFEIDIDDKLTHTMEQHKFLFALESILTNAIESNMKKIELGKLSTSLPVKIKSTFDDESKMLLTLVEDQGEGIEEQVKSKLFTSGFTTKEGRFGMGLHNSYNFIYSMRGAIELKSSGKNEGATFMIKIPK